MLRVQKRSIAKCNRFIKSRPGDIGSKIHGTFCSTWITNVSTYFWVILPLSSLSHGWILLRNSRGFLIAWWWRLIWNSYVRWGAIVCNSIRASWTFVVILIKILFNWAHPLMRSSNWVWSWTSSSKSKYVNGTCLALMCITRRLSYSLLRSPLPRDFPSSLLSSPITTKSNCDGEKQDKQNNEESLKEFRHNGIGTTAQWTTKPKGTKFLS